MRILTSTAIALALTAGASQAATYDVLPTSNPITGEEVSLWFEELIEGAGMVSFLLNEAGRYTTFADGTSTLTATAYAMGDASTGFEMSFSFSDNVPAGSVYKDVFGRYGGVVPGNIELSVITAGQLSGFGDYESLEMGLSQFPSPFNAVTQVGGGTVGGGTANQHNENFGMSSWFAIDTRSFDAACVVCANLSTNLIGSQGDVIFDLVPATVPVPAGILFSLTGLAALGFARRKS